MGIGIIVGILLRDLGVARAQIRVWPIQSSVIDWERVERMAEGEVVS